MASARPVRRANQPFSGKAFRLTEQPNTTAVDVTSTQYTDLRPLYDPDMDFRNLAQSVKSGYIARGFRLVSKDALIDVPHLVLAVTYREGFLMPVERGYGKGIKGDYISLETVVADKETLALPQFKHVLANRALEVFPNETAVYNDGGTGIRRKITQLLHDTGVINVGGNLQKDGERIYDRPFALWEWGADRAQDGITADADGEPFKYLVPRGLRRSDYEWEGQPAVTFYFA